MEGYVASVDALNENAEYENKIANIKLRLAGWSIALSISFFATLGIIIYGPTDRIPFWASAATLIFVIVNTGWVLPEVIHRSMLLYKALK